MRMRLKVVVAPIKLGLAFGSAYAQTGGTNPGVTAIRYVTVLVKDYDQALAWYRCSRS
jgi:hypothetical protein